MNRLKHSPDGFIRSLLISRYQLLAFVEGETNDPYFYDKLCSFVCQPSNTQYLIRLANQIPGEAGGKNQLISFFEYLTEKSLLLAGLDGNKKIFIFFLDKDIDDFLGKQIQSRHIIYTEYYTIENHLFANGNVVEAVAASSSLPSGQVAEKIGNSDVWRQNIASAWIDWIKLSLFARKYEIDCECNFKALSRINKPLYKNSVDRNLFAKYLNLLQHQSGFSEDEFQTAYQEIADIVDGVFAQGKFDLIFQGKWYSKFMVEEIREMGSSTNGLHGRLESTLMLSLDFNEPWAKHFVIPLQRAINLLK